MVRSAGSVVRESDSGGITAGNVTVLARAALLGIRGATAATDVFSSGVTGDVTDRFVIDADGKLQWGDGISALDTFLYRVGIGQVKTDSFLKAGNQMVARTGLAAQTIIGDAGPSAQAGILFGSAADTNLYRVGADSLQTDDFLLSAVEIVARVSTSGDTRIGAVGPGGKAGILFATGVGQANLYKGAADKLQTDDGFNLNNGTLAGAASAVGPTLYGGTGAPNNANGVNGDIYIDVGGGVLTTIYQRRAGAWVGIV